MMSQMGKIEIADPTIMQMHALELKPRASAFLPLHRPAIVRRCNGNSDLLLYFQSITVQLYSPGLLLVGREAECQNDHMTVGWKESRCPSLYIIHLSSNFLDQ